MTMTGGFPPWKIKAQIFIGANMSNHMFMGV